jgi:hypothetical protein
MTEVSAPPVSVPAGPEPGIPGISGAELAAMLAGSRRFLAAHDAGPAVRARSAADLAALTADAGPLAAGLTSPLRSQYMKKRGTHFMFMLSAGR